MTIPSTTQRNVVALNADVVGYSRLMADDFTATSAAMASVRDLVLRCVVAGGGRLVNFVGDNFMAVFDEPTAAIHTAIAITTDLEARSAPGQPTIRFRMGLDQGPVADVGDDIEGEALNVASRIEGIAPDGGISISERVYRALDEPALRFRGRGAQALKNIPGAVGIFDLVGLPTHDRSLPATPLALEAPTVAVLPIHTQTVDAAVKRAAELVRMELLHRLAAVPELSVIDARNVSDPSAPDVAARYMLESGVYATSSGLRVFTTLFDVTTMNIVKSHKWNTDDGGVASLAEDVADEVARSIEVDLVVGAPAGLYADLGDPVAIQKVYRGWFHLRSDTQESWVEAMRLFEEVAADHPNQPFGHVLSAFALWLGAANGWVSDQAAAMTTAMELAERGIAVGDPTGMAAAVKAAVLMNQGDVDEAINIMDEVEIVRPTCDVTYGLEGSLRRYLGQWERAVDLLDVAMRLTGVNKPWYPTVKACSLFIGNRLEQAAAVAESVLSYQPHNLEALLVLAAAQKELGLDRRAEATARVIRERFPSVDVADWLTTRPYQDEAITERWTADLAALGLVPGS